MISKELHDLVDKDRESCCLHSLSNKCKEWASINGWYLWIEWKSGGNFCVKIARDETTIFGVTEFYDWSEQEAIFKACEYILKENK